MISFKSRQPIIAQADRITRLANTVYPHISESKTRINIDKITSENDMDMYQCFRFARLKLKHFNKIDNLRYHGGYGLDLFKNIINMLKNNQIGNCYELAVLAQIIGKINGLKNIYPAKIFFVKNSSGADMELDHVVAVITDKKFDKDIKFKFNQKDGIILDPWLGITDFTGNYFNRIRHDFIKFFPRLSNDDSVMRRFAKESKNIEEFNRKRNDYFKHQFFLKLHNDELLSDSNANILKQEYPELILK